MKAWILSIVGIMFIGVIIEIIMPEGKTNTFIKSMFAIVFMYVVMSPIINLIKDANFIDFNEIFNMGNEEIVDEWEELHIDIKC